MRNWQMFHKSGSRFERGQSLIEVALFLTLLLLILSGLLDLGRAYITYVSLEDGAGEAALYMAINPDCPYDDSDPNNGVCDIPNNGLWRARNSGGGLVDWSSATVTFTDAPPYMLEDAVAVIISYPFELLTPFIPQLAGSDVITMTTHASQVVTSK